MYSKNKGNKAERDVAKKLSLWVSNGKNDLIFSRRSGSGGAPRDKSGSTGKGGDIFADAKEGEAFCNKFSIEVKHYKDLTSDLWQLVESSKGRFIDFITQANYTAIVDKKDFLIVAKSNFRGVLILFNSKTLITFLHDRIRSCVKPVDINQAPVIASVVCRYMAPVKLVKQDAFTTVSYNLKKSKLTQGMVFCMALDSLLSIPYSEIKNKIL